jgi:osmotically-inducible protein OsmY
MTDWDLRIGAQVHCKDGRCGKLLALVTDPETDQVTDLVVEKGLLLKKDRVIPLAKVIKSTDEEVHVALGRDEMSDYPEFDEKQLRVEGPGYDKSEEYGRQARVHDAGYYGQPGSVPALPQLRQEIQVEAGVRSKSIVIGRGTEVKTVEGDVGRVDHVLVDPKTGDVTYVVVDPGLFGKALAIPMDFVRQIGQEGITLDIDEDDLEKMPPYTPRGDEEIEADIREQLLRQLPQYGGVEVAVMEGVAQMRGTAPDLKAKRHLEAVVRSVEGVVDVDDAVEAKSTIEERVTAALQADPRTKEADIKVINHAGVVTLKGQVKSEHVCRAAIQVAAAQTRVIKVTSELEVQPAEAS